MSNANDRTSKGYMKDLEEAAGVKTNTPSMVVMPSEKEEAKTDPAPKCPGSPPLDNVGIKMLWGAFEIYGRIIAIQTRVEGMKVANLEALNSGHTTPDYSESSFRDASYDITQLAKQLAL